MVYVNNSDDEEDSLVSNVISNAFCDNPEYKEYCETDKDNEYFGKWKDNKELSDITGVEKLIRSGVVL